MFVFIIDNRTLFKINELLEIYKIIMIFKSGPGYVRLYRYMNFAMLYKYIQGVTKICTFYFIFIFILSSKNASY